LNIDFSKYDFAEVVEIDGIMKVQYRKRGESQIIIEDEPSDLVLKKLKETAAWKLPGDLDPKLDKDHEFYIDHDARKGERGHIPTVLRNIAQEMEYIFSTCYSFADQKYAALITMFVLDTYFKNSFDHAPRITIISETMGGKTKLLMLVKYTGYRVKQSVDVSGASLFRSVEMFNITHLYDESQDMSKDSREFFNVIWKAGADKDGGGVERCDKDFVPMSYNVYSPMIKSVMPGNKDKSDIENRTFTVHTRRKMSEKKLEKLNKERLKELRTELYRIKICLEKYPYALDLKKMAEESDEELMIVETTIEEEKNAKEKYPILYEYKKKEGLLGDRPRDMSVPYYTLAKVAGFEKEIIPLCYELNEKTKQTKWDSEHGCLFRDYLDIALNPIANETTIETLNLFSLEERLFKISTKDIKNRHNKDMDEKNEKPLETSYVTSVFSGLGFTLKGITQGQKFIVHDEKFNEIFKGHLEDYGTEDQQSEFEQFNF